MVYKGHEIDRSLDSDSVTLEAVQESCCKVELF